MPPFPTDSDFPPPRRPGLILLGTAILIFAGGSALSFYVTFQAGETASFLVSLAVGLVLFAPIPLLGYQAYALLSASYTLERDGLRIHWGLRAEDIPLPEIEWVRSAGDLATHLPMPWPRWTGAILGRRHVEGLGPVEFLAADARTLLLVATPSRIYAISPADPRAFLNAFRRANELGSLSPIKAQSANPTLLVGNLWSDPPGRALVLAGLALELALLLSVMLAIPTRPALSLGFATNGQPTDPGPSARLLLLPVLNGVYFLVDLLAGLFFYRRSTRSGALEISLSPVEVRAYRVLAYVLWASAVLTGLIMLVGVVFILSVH